MCCLMHPYRAFVTYLMQLFWFTPDRIFLLGKFYIKQLKIDIHLKSVFKILGKIHYHCPNRPQRLCYVNL